MYTMHGILFYSFSSFSSLSVIIIILASPFPMFLLRFGKGILYTPDVNRIHINMIGRTLTPHEVGHSMSEIQQVHVLFLG